MIETVRVSQKARDQLILLKRRTRIPNWNTLCRWAFCVSLAEPHPPTAHHIKTDSSVEMTWKVFGGAHAEHYWALLKQRCRRDGIATDNNTLAHYFKLHLHRGIGYLAGDRELLSVSQLLDRVGGDPGSFSAS
ncbi:MAG: DNA sulfur modification protein DndE [Gemmatimonadota bacterium]|nr:DNA sulfur modification protein DndE [Gemmatimonadota bacterium]